MAKLPERQKVSLLVFRRSSPDQVLVVAREGKRAHGPALPAAEAEAGERARDVALRLAPGLVHGRVLGDLDLGLSASYRVREGPHAGEWTERFHAVEVAVDAAAREGEWLAHYDAKAAAGAGSPRVREAFTRLRELARLKP